MLEVFRRTRTQKSLSKETRHDVRFDASDPSLPSFAKLSRMAREGGRSAFLTFLDNQHTREEVPTWLAQPEVHKVLRRLRVRGAITEAQWQLLYPPDKRLVNMDNFDLPLLVLLVKYASQLRKPYPNGWNGPPRDTDISSGAMALRFQTTRRELAFMTYLSDEHYQVLARDLRRCLVHFGGDEIKTLMRHKHNESIDKDEAALELEIFREWHSEEERIADTEEAVQSAKEHRSADIPVLQSRILPRADLPAKSAPMPRGDKGGGQRQQVPSPNARNRWADINVGMVTEEKNILEKFYDRLVTEVKPDAIMDYLQKKKVMNMEESNDVFSILKSQDQMKILLDIVVRRPGHSFMELINSLKGRYGGLYTVIYEEFTKVMEQIKAAKPEGIPYCQQLIQHTYQHMFASWTPILWYPDQVVHLEDFYCPLRITDNKLNQIAPNELFAMTKTGKIPGWVVVEGESGTGKSTLAKYLTYMWTQDPDYFGHKFKLVLLIDLKITAPSVKYMLIEQLFGGTFKLSERELWDVVDDYQEDILFILDGYEGTAPDDVKEMLRGELVPDVHMLLLAHSHFTPELKGRYDFKYTLTGFEKHAEIEFVQKYIKLSQKPQDQFALLISNLAGKKPPQRRATMAASHFSDQPRRGTMMPSHTTNVAAHDDAVHNKDKDDLDTAMGIVPVRQKPGNVLPGALICFKRPVKEDDGKNSKFRKFSAKPQESEEEAKLYALQRNLVLRFYAQIPVYCMLFCGVTENNLGIDLCSLTGMIEHFLNAVKNKLIDREHLNRYNVNKAYIQLSELALGTIARKDPVVTVEDDTENKEIMLKFGILQEATSLLTKDQGRYFFPCRIFQDYFAAKGLDTGGLDETSRFFQTILLERHLHNVSVLYCGMRKNDGETNAMRALFTKINDGNERISRKHSFRRSEDAAGRTEGKIMDYQIGLECIGLMEGRVDHCNNISKTMPSCIRVENDGFIPIHTILGLAYFVEANTDKLTEISIRLDHLANHSAHAYMRLALALQTNEKIETLRIYWQHRDLTINFFSTVCEKNTFLKTIECVDQSKSRADKISPKIWNDIRRGCQSMTNVVAFAFKQCRHMPLVNAVIRNLPTTLVEVDFSGCDLNIIGSHDLAEKITRSRGLRRVVLSGVRIEGMAFNTFINALSSNRSVTELNLSNVKLDNVCFFALSEALKVNNKLERLILTDTLLNKRSCEELAQVMKMNTTLKELHVSKEKVDSDGKPVLRMNAKHITIHGLDHRRTSIDDALASVTRFG